jgi:hypothetical protein
MVRFDRVTQASLHAALQRVFPDARVKANDLEALAVSLWRARQAGETLPPDLARIDLSAYSAELSDLSKGLGPNDTASKPQVGPDAYRYYWVQSEHSRLDPPGFEPFVGELAMVRVTLPARTPKTFRTQIGDVEPGDHLIDTLLEANQKYARFLEAPLGRVDLVTPPRQGVRFGAISVLLGYKKPKDPLPFCYILEGGTATGQPKVLYLGKTLGATINAYAGYQPTPFACPSHAYLGKLTLDGDEPKLLEIAARKVEGGVSQAPYIKIRASFQRQQGSLRSIWPGFLIARAASIVWMRELKGTIVKDCELPPPEKS